MIARTGSGDGDQQLRFKNQNYSTSLHEHSPINTKVITVELENPQSGVTFSFASGNEAEGFNIHSSTGSYLACFLCQPLWLGQMRVPAGGQVMGSIPTGSSSILS